MVWEHVQIQKPESGLAAGEVLLHFQNPAEVPLITTPNHPNAQWASPGKFTDSHTSLI